MPGWIPWTGIDDQKDWIYPNEWFQFKKDDDFPPGYTGMGASLIGRPGVTVMYVGVNAPTVHQRPNLWNDNTVHDDTSRSQIKNLYRARQALELKLIDSYIEAPE